MAATCDGLGDSQVKPICESKLAAASGILRTLSKRYRNWGSLRPAVDCLKRFRKLLSTAKASHSYRKATVNSCKLGGTEPQGISRAGQTLLAGLMDIWHSPGFVALPTFLSGRKLPPGSLADARHFSFSVYATGAFQAATLVLELRQSESVNLCVDYLRGTAWDSRNFFY